MSRKRLRNLFGEAVTELMLFHEQQFLALMNGDAELERYEILIHMASEKRQAAKYGYMAHIEAHGCEAPAQAALAEFVRGPRKSGRKAGTSHGSIKPESSGGGPSRSSERLMEGLIADLPWTRSHTRKNRNTH
jgi:hypothetical protein